MILRRTAVLSSNQKPYNYSKLLLWLDGTTNEDKGPLHRTVTVLGTITTNLDHIFHKGSNVKCYSKPQAGYWNLNNTAAFDMTKWTICMWTYTTAVYSSWSALWGIGRSTSSYYTDFRFRYSSTSYFGYAGRKGSSSASIDTLSSTISNLNTNYFIVNTMDGAINNFYLDTELKQTLNLSFSYGTSESPTAFYIGTTHFNAGTESTTGYFSDIRMYNYVLSANEILKIYNKGPKNK